MNPTYKNVWFMILTCKDDCVNYNFLKKIQLCVKCSINICLLVGYNKKNIWQYIIQYNISFIIVLLGSHGNVNRYKKLYVYYCL